MKYFHMFAGLTPKLWTSKVLQSIAICMQTIAVYCNLYAIYCSLLQSVCKLL